MKNKKTKEGHKGPKALAVGRKCAGVGTWFEGLFVGEREIEWWTIFVSVGLIAYRERKAHKRSRGGFLVCFMKYLQRRRKE